MAGEGSMTNTVVMPRLVKRERIFRERRATLSRR